MTDLSPAAQAVMVAATMGNPNVINDPVYRQCIAVALRAVAALNTARNQREMKQRLLIAAAELEGAQ